VTYHNIEFTKDEDGFINTTCSCGWQCLPVPDYEIGAEAWADHYAEEHVIPRFSDQLKELRAAEHPKNVEVLYGVEWKPGNIEYWESADTAHDALFYAEDVDGAKMIKSIQIKEYI